MAFIHRQTSLCVKVIGLDSKKSSTGDCGGSTFVAVALIFTYVRG